MYRTLLSHKIHPLKEFDLRYKIKIEYDGTNLVGWQRQLDGSSAQQFIEDALFDVCGNSELKLINKKNCENINILEQSNTESDSGNVFKKQFIVEGAGRTDAGVHAIGQVAHFDLENDWEPFRLQRALNAGLRKLKAPVSILEVEKVSNDFHARFSAQKRGYIYKILNRPSPPVLDKNRVWWVSYPLDIENMRQGAKYLLGHHDFSSFRASECQALSPEKTLDRLDIEKIGDEIIFTVEAKSFLHHQVRNFVGTLQMVGGGYFKPQDVKTILEAKDRTKAGVTAPASGLYLNKVVY